MVFFGGGLLLLYLHYFGFAKSFGDFFMGFMGFCYCYWFYGGLEWFCMVFKIFWLLLGVISEAANWLGYRFEWDFSRLEWVWIGSVHGLERNRYFLILRVT